MNYYIYIVECSDGALYTGFTTDIKHRIDQHNNSKKFGAKSLRGKLPVRLVYNETFETKIDALKREREIKSWPRIRKLELLVNRII